MKREDLPKISILIAARNEEASILHCLQSIEKLHYPPSHLEVLIGNDASQDRTLDLLKSYARGKPPFRVFDIQEQLSGQQGKANVLAQLAREAKGEIYFFTDADTVLSPDCLDLAALFLENESLGVVAGLSLINTNSLFSILQCLEWLEAFYWVKTASLWKIPVTAMGNNLFVKREAYEAVGGYEKIPFSLTEDFELFHQIVGKGFDFYQYLEDNSKIAYTEGASNLRELLQQRKRWMRGARQLAWWLQLPLFLSSLSLPMAFLGFYWYPVVTLWAMAILFFVKDFILLRLLLGIQKTALIRYLLIYNLYKPLLDVLILIYYFLPLKVRWKGRVYD